MPIYEYRCKKCDTVFEKIVFGSNPEVACEACGSNSTDKLMSRFGMGRSSSAPASSGGSSCGGCTSSSCAGCK